MIRWFRQYISVSRNALTVSMSDPVYLILLLSVLTGMAFFGTLPTFNFGQEMRLVRDQGMALVFLGGCVTAALGLVTVVVRDLRGGAISILMSRPITGLTLVLGKWTGLAGALLIYHIPASVACLWLTRIAGAGGEHGRGLDMTGLAIYFAAIVIALGAMGLKHYFFGGWYVWQASLAIVVVFTLAFLLANFVGEGAHYHWGTGVDWRALNGCILLYLAELIFVALLMPFAVRFDAALVMGMGVVVFFLGMVSNFLVNAMVSPGIIYYVVKSAVPNWQAFWISDWLATRGDLDWGQVWPYIGSCTIHTVAYVTVCLTAAAFLFNRQEFHGNDTL